MTPVRGRRSVDSDSTSTRFPTFSSMASPLTPLIQGDTTPHSRPRHRPPSWAARATSASKSAHGAGLRTGSRTRVRTQRELTMRQPRARELWTGERRGERRNAGDEASVVSPPSRGALVEVADACAGERARALPPIDGCLALLRPAPGAPAALGRAARGGRPLTPRGGCSLACGGLLHLLQILADPPARPAEVLARVAERLVDVLEQFPRAARHLRAQILQCRLRGLDRVVQPAERVGRARCRAGALTGRGTPGLRLPFCHLSPPSRFDLPRA